MHEQGTTSQVPDKAEVRRRLELIFDWYRGMIDQETGRLVYVYDPERPRRAGRKPYSGHQEHQQRGHLKTG